MDTRKGKKEDGDAVWERFVEGLVIPRKIEEIQFLIDTSENPDYEGGERYGFQVEEAWLE